MQFIIRAYDGPGKLEERLAVRPDHLKNLQKVMDRVVCAGGLLDDQGKMKGSVLIMDFDSRAELDEYLASEPYVTAKVWDKIEVELMNVVIGGR